MPICSSPPSGMILIFLLFFLVFFLVIACFLIETSALLLTFLFLSRAILASCSSTDLRSASSLAFLDSFNAASFSLASCVTDSVFLFFFFGLFPETAAFSFSAPLFFLLSVFKLSSLTLAASFFLPDLAFSLSLPFSFFALRLSLSSLIFFIALSGFISFPILN